MKISWQIKGGIFFGLDMLLGKIIIQNGFVVIGDIIFLVGGLGVLIMIAAYMWDPECWWFDSDYENVK